MKGESEKRNSYKKGEGTDFSDEQVVDGPVVSASDDVYALSFSYAFPCWRENGRWIDNMRYHAANTDGAATQAGNRT